MVVRKDRYKITWSERGERAREDPETVTAHTYEVDGDFFTFYDQSPYYSDGPFLRVRMSDVREIRRVEDQNDA
jgi:hypothetical protein